MFEFDKLGCAPPSSDEVVAGERWEMAGANV